jgi:hypothetical protein
MQPTPALNAHLAEAAPLGENDPPRCEVALAATEPALGSRYMRERLEDRVEYIEARFSRERLCAGGAVAAMALLARDAAPRWCCSASLRARYCAPPAS